MLHRTLPGTDLSLSVVGMGCWTIGGDYWGGADEAQSVAAVRAAVEAGINWFDTAPLYGNGRSDRVLAKALGSHIHQVVIATKVGVRLPGDGGEHARSDLRPEHVVADCEASLRRLKEPLDLLQVHWPCEEGTPLQDTIAALEDLQDRGWIRHWGLCNYDAAEVRQARLLGRVASLQTPYSLLRRELEGELRDACLEPGPHGQPIGILAYEVLCRGLLTGRYPVPPSFPEEDMRSWDERFSGPRFLYANGIAQDLARIGRKLGLSGAAVALAWAARQEGVTAVIAGARSPEQIRQSARAWQLLERDKVWQVVDQVIAGHGQPP